MADVHVAVNQICIFNQYKVDNLPQPGFEDLNLNNTYTGVMQKLAIGHHKIKNLTVGLQSGIGHIMYYHRDMAMICTI